MGNKTCAPSCVPHKNDPEGINSHTMLACAITPVQLSVDRTEDFIHGGPMSYRETDLLKMAPESPYQVTKISKRNVGKGKDPSSSPPTPPLTPETQASTVSVPSVPSISLPMPKPQPIKRHQSAPSPCSNRRSIFGGGVWRQAPKQAPCSADCGDHSASSLPHEARSPPNSSCRDPREIRRLVRPPPDRLVDKPHFVDLDRLPPAASYYLPDLPYPLRRFFEKGTRTQLSGVYPMVSPTPILRESSYSAKNGTDSFNEGSSSSSIMPSSFNLTSTLRKDEAQKLINDLDMSSTSTSSKSSTARTSIKVHFDPRVTVTEFEDESPRHWFSDSDLERFKWETIHLVRKYLVANPSLIDKYNKPYLEPITGKYRRRALYSIPVLGSNFDEEDLEHSRACSETMAKAHVRNILLAARNRLVLDLLGRSLKTIFPHAKIVTATSGEEALELFHKRASSKDVFDLVLADGRLNRSLHTHTCSLNRLDLVRGGGLSRSTGSLADLDKPVPQGSSIASVVSGAELFRQIAEMKATSSDADASYSLDNVSPLLIGITTTPEADGKAMQENGASLVWGLPPPRMDEHLRDELVSMLIQKRHTTTTTTI